VLKSKDIDNKYLIWLVHYKNNMRRFQTKQTKQQNKTNEETK